MNIFKIIKKGGINIYKMNLYISSYIPIFLMIFIKSMENISLKQISITFLKNWMFWGAVILLCVICILVLLDFLKNLKSTEQNNTKSIDLSDENIKSHESEVLNYFITFLIPILTLNPVSWPSIWSNIILILLIGVYFVKNNLLSFNILLIVLNYNIYKDQYSNIYISKASINEIKIHNLKAYPYKQTNVFYISKKK
ncbi:TPA: hypothetical protein PIW27_000178 [Staphylococcus aureus]|uniref:hypothetical protein n=2 Tax=Staphylococcus aureus TaxID=1280 RepID=UPI0006BADE82|nr:hypothetical protein [Staphylococcus aureus]MCQ1158473.1 hypothetical protein [Staphylococcus aureus]MCQ1295017.1 hypothetical protein [Staphylococcus aureus]HAR4535575.1 hypothetical protein [Staphylococcus aureus]HCV4144300.1 hypothetical protein [Staphylococcus aureus]HCV7112116.1 hypothetical protein [Staphylococcus aureus]